jgi:hypothetical protein
MAKMKKVRGGIGLKRKGKSEERSSGKYSQGIRATADPIPRNRVDPVVNAHGFGHTKGQCEGPLRMSGDSRAHRVGK